LVVSTVSGSRVLASIPLRSRRQKGCRTEIRVAIADDHPTVRRLKALLA
jgi:hypothetical protein